MRRLAPVHSAEQPADPKQGSEHNLPISLTPLVGREQEMAAAYRCSHNHIHGKNACSNSKNFRAEELEQRIW